MFNKPDLSGVSNEIQNEESQNRLDEEEEDALDKAIKKLKFHLMSFGY